MKPKPNRSLSLPWNPQREKTSGNHLLRRNKATSLTSPIYLTIIPRARVGHEEIDSQRGAKRRVGYNHLL